MKIGWLGRADCKSQVVEEGLLGPEVAPETFVGAVVGVRGGRVWRVGSKIP